MEYNLKVSGPQLQAIWAGLSELPAKVSYAVLKSLETQIKEQEQADREAAKPAVPSEPAGDGSGTAN